MRVATKCVPGYAPGSRSLGAPMSSDDFKQLGSGTHKYRVDGDQVTIRSFGVTTIDDLNAITQLYQSVREQHSSLFALYDSREGGGINRSARKALLEPARPESRPDAAATFGAKFSSRILISMINRVLVSFGRSTTGVEMFETESQARMYLEKERVRLGKVRST
jgi:hypothetical protein